MTVTAPHDRLRMTFRWFGDADPVPLSHIRQIPAVTGIVSALYDVPVGDVWPAVKLKELRRKVEDCGLALSVIESVPVHEDIKLGRPGCGDLLAAYRKSIENMGAAGISILCYNFMPVFDWTRTGLASVNPDGSTSLVYDHDEALRMDPAHGTGDLPGWATGYDPEERIAYLEAYRSTDGGALFGNLVRFLKSVVPAAEASGVRMGIHPDDPPWPLFGLPRVVKDELDIDRLLDAVDSPANGVTFCTGSLAPGGGFDLVRALERYSRAGRVPFVHMRNIARTGARSFRETSHPSAAGDIDMHAVMKALVDTGFDGAVRPDHGRMIWGERGRPGYGLYDRALGAMYLAGLHEAIVKERESGGDMTAAIPSSKRPSNIEELARICGVSISTVSRALNNEPGISAETRRTVMREAKKHGFELRARKRPLARSVLGLAVVVPEESELSVNPFLNVTELLAAINEAFSEEKKRVEIVTPEGFAALLHGRSGAPDGVLVAYRDMPDALRRRLAALEVPCVFLSRSSPGDNHVSCNGYKGMVRLGEMLVAGGRGRIGYLGSAGNPNNRDRLRGYLTAMTEAGRGPSECPQKILPTMHDIDRDTARFFIDAGCDGVMCFNDYMAIELIKRLADAGVAVPSGMAVTGFDDSPLSRIFSPTITTVGQPAYEMTFLASRWLRDNILNRARRELRIEVDGHVIVRESSGPLAVELSD